MIAEALALALAASPCAAPSRGDGPLPWGTGERLRFALGSALLPAGTLELSVERPMAGGRLLPLRARHSAAGFGGSAGRALVAFSWVDAGTLAPQRYREEVAAGGRRRTTDARPGAGGGELVLEVDAGSGGERRAYARAGAVYDPLSLLYLLRTARIAPGDRFCFDLVADGRYWAVLAVAAPRRERVDSPSGPTDALWIDLVLRRADRPGQRRVARVRVGAGPDRAILAVEAETEGGVLRATLLERTVPHR